MRRLAVLLVAMVAVLGCADDAQQLAERGGEPAGGGAGEVTAGPVEAPATQPRPAEAKARPQDARAVREILKSRLARLDSIIVDFNSKVTYPPLRPGEKAIVRPKGKNFRIIRVTGVREWQQRFMRLGRSSRYEKRLVAVEGAAQGPDWRPRTETEIRTFWPEGSEYLGLDKDDNPVRAAVYDPKRLPSPEIEIALGLRAHGQVDRLTEEAIDGMRLDLPDGDRAIMWCKDNEGFKHEWTFLRKYGYALGRYHRSPPASGHGYHIATMSDFRDADGMILPYAMAFVSKTVIGETTRVNMTTEIKVSRYEIGRADNTARRYRIAWPAKARVFDKRRRAKSRPATMPTTQPAARPAGKPASRPVRTQPAAIRPPAGRPGRTVPKGYLERLNLLNNIIADYQVTSTVSDPLVLSRLASQPAAPIVFRMNKQYMRLHGRSRYESVRVPESESGTGPISPKAVFAEIQSFGPQGGAYLALSRFGQPVRAMTADYTVLPTPDIELMLGMRPMRGAAVLSADKMNQVDFEAAGKGQVVMRTRKWRGWINEWVLDERLGYAPILYRRLHRPDDRVTYEAVMSQFKEVRGLMLPYKAEITTMAERKGRIVPSRKDEIVVTSYRIGHRSNTPGRYPIEFPPGTNVTKFSARSGRAAEPQPTSRPAATPQAPAPAQ